jgi:hypothetical protein
MFAHTIDTKIAHNAIQPSGDLGLALEPVWRHFLQPNKRVLRDVFGLAAVAQQAVCMCQNQRGQALGQSCCSALITIGKQHQKRIIAGIGQSIQGHIHRAKGHK